MTQPQLDELATCRSLSQGDGDFARPGASNETSSPAASGGAVRATANPAKGVEGDLTWGGVIGNCIFGVIPGVARIADVPDNAAAARNARDDPSFATAARLAATQVAPSTSYSYLLDGTSVSSNGDLKAWYVERSNRLTEQANEIRVEKALPPPSIAQAIAKATANAGSMKGAANEPLDDAALQDAAEWLDMYENGLLDGENVKARLSADKMREAANTMEASNEKIQQRILPALRDAQREAYRNDQSNQILTIADGIATALDTSLTLKKGIQEMREVAFDITALELKWLGKATPPTKLWVPKVLEISEKINKAYAAFQLARGAIGMVGGGTSSAEEGRKAVSAMSTVVSAGGTLLNASSGMTIYANLYIGPMVDKCLVQLQKLENLVADQNLRLMKAAHWDLVAWDVEPGGKPMFSFLSASMKASGPEGVPSPVPSAISKLMLAKEDELNAGTGKDSLPTTGHLFWRKVDPTRIAEWVFTHRHEIWQMHYGSAPPPR